jgi:hypothetical protein
MAQYAAAYIKTPLFVLNSALDSCQACATVHRVGISAFL